MISVVCHRRAPRSGLGATLGLGSIAAILLLAQPAAAQLTPFGQPAQPVQLQQAPFQTIPAAPAPGTYQPAPGNYAAPGAGPSTFSFAAPPPQIVVDWGWERIDGAMQIDCGGEQKEAPVVVMSSDHARSEPVSSGLESTTLSDQMPLPERPSIALRGERGA